MLDDRIRSRILDDHKKLTADGKLLSRSQLDACYRTFRTRFGPDVLAGLDGEDLLEAMHSHGNRDSLVYWLEFKNDEEFPAKFGSIAGGSALKFGIFRSNETRAWMTGSPRDMKEVSVPEAVEIARRHRDQLIRGAERVGTVPELADDAEYRRLQADLDRIAPKVNDSAWGHKYFSLLHPEKLDDYHNPSYQRFHLVKMLQTLPVMKGRYVCAGSYVSIAAGLALPLNHLTTILNAQHGEPHRYWRVNISQGDKKCSPWSMMRDDGCLAFGWDKLGEVCAQGSDRLKKADVRSCFARSYPDPSRWNDDDVSALFDLMRTIELGDIVVVCEDQMILGIGRVIGDYEHAALFDHPHRRPVDWLAIGRWGLEVSEKADRTIKTINMPSNHLQIEKILLDASRSSAPNPIGIRVGSPARLDGIPGRIQAVLERKGQAILYGPPGTGKTYWAERTALELASHSLAGRPFDQLSDDERVRVTGGPDSLGTVRMVSFHPAYGYEDFIEGYRPELHDGRMAFALRDGIFKQLCRDAESQPGRQFHLIIDEINRGDIPRIFGELLTAIEKDKRGKPVILPMSRSAFRVPPNVLIIGTMNTADRSIALLDTALRRRFGFVELMPDASLLGGSTVADIPLGPWLEALNRRICEHVGRDARNLQVGHSFLMEGGKPLKDAGRFFRVVRDEIIPLLEEYCYEDFDALHNILGSGLVDLPGRAIRHDLFEEPTGPELVQALLAPCPDILTSIRAVATAEGDEGQGEPGEGDDETGASP